MNARDDIEHRKLAAGRIWRISRCGIKDVIHTGGISTRMGSPDRS